MSKPMRRTSISSVSHLGGQQAVVAAGEIYVYFSTHWFGNVDVGFDGCCLIMLNQSNVDDVFWTNTKYNFFVNVLANVLNGSCLSAGIGSLNVLASM